MEDIGLVLADFVATLGDLPPNIRTLMEEVQRLDEQSHKAHSRARQSERALQKHLRDKANRDEATEEEVQLAARSKRGLTKAQELTEEKIQLLKKAQGMVQLHLKTLDAEIKKFKKDGQHFADSGESLGNLTPLLARPGAGPGARTYSMGYATPRRDSYSNQYLMATDEENEDLADSTREGHGGVGGGLLTPTRVPQRRRHRGREDGAVAGTPGSGEWAVAAMSSAATPGGVRGVRRYKKHPRQPYRIGRGVAGGIAPAEAMDIESGEGIEESDDQLYCFCQQVSFGDMVACDGPNCPYEWFHWDCVGLTSPPQGSWFCKHCQGKGDGASSNAASVVT